MPITNSSSRHCTIGQYDFGYRCYDHVEKKLIGSREDIDNVERLSSSSNSDLIYVDPITVVDGAIHEDASQQEEEHEDVGESMVVDDRVNASYGVV